MKTARGRFSGLLRWYGRHQRKLPWRDHPDPYRVWLSELMLQQTQVQTVIPYFERFIEHLPDVDAVANATEQEVLTLWSGLGYYRRARSFHAAAKTIAFELGGRFPEDVAGWLRLPGVGRYTAGAIVSIAFGVRAPILDGNVARVLSRVCEVHGNPRKGESKRRLWELATEILPDRSISEFNQALMELGALVCVPRNPRCVICPLRDTCAAKRLGLEQTLPELPPPKKSVHVTLAAAVIEEKGKLLVYRREGVELMKNMWEFPEAECRDGEDPRAALAREAREKYGLDLTPGRELAKVKHSIMNRRIDLRAYAAKLESRPPRIGKRKWVSPEELLNLPTSSMIHKVLGKLNPDG